MVAGMPEWFAKQFGSTWLAQSPFGLTGSFYFIATLETAAFFGFFGSVLRLEWLRGDPLLLRVSLAFSMLVFLVLAYGSRLTGKFDIAGWNYVYLFGTLVTAHLLDRPNALSSADPSRKGNL